jgi:hypothetical protein
MIALLSRQARVVHLVRHEADRPCGSACIADAVGGFKHADWESRPAPAPQ